MDETEDERRRRESEEYGRSLLGSLLNGGFWTLITGGLMTVLFGFAVRGNLFGLRDWIEGDDMRGFIEETFGARGLVFANRFLGTDFEGAEETAFMEMDAGEAVSTIEGYIADYNRENEDNIIIGRHALRAMVGPPSRRQTTLDLLKAQGFTPDEPNLTPDMVRSALVSAMQSNEHADYIAAVLSALGDDIVEINSGSQQQNVALVDRLWDMAESLLNDETIDRSGVSFARHPAFIGALLQSDPERGIGLLIRMTSQNGEYAMIETFLEANQQALTTLIETVPANQVSTITAMFDENGFSLESLLENPQLLQGVSQHREAIETFLRDIDPASLPEAEQAQFELAREFLLAGSDSTGSSNLAVISARATNHAFLEALSGVINPLLQGNSSLEDLNITQATADQIRETIEQLDFDMLSGSAHLAAVIGPAEATAIISFSHVPSLAPGYETLIGTFAGELLPEGVDVDTDILSEIADMQSPDEGNIDRIFSVAAGSAIQQITR